MTTLAENAALLKAAADPVRARILSMLGGGELCACQIVAVLALPASTVSRHLSTLTGAGFVRERKVGKWVHFSLAGKEAPAPVRSLLKSLLAGLADDPTVIADAKRTAVARTAGAKAICAADMKLPKAMSCCPSANPIRSKPSKKPRTGGSR